MLGGGALLLGPQGNESVGLRLMLYGTVNARSGFGSWRSFIVRHKARYITLNDHAAVLRSDGEEKVQVLPFRHMTLRSCKVTCRDAEGIEHSVQVTAQTLYEAVAQALRIFREHEWCDRHLRGSGASVLVKITPPEVEHRVQIRDFASWLDSVSKSPAETILKNRLREIVSG